MVERLINHTGRVNCPFDGNLTGLCLFTVFYSVFLTVFKPSERPVSWPVMWETQFDAVAHNVWHQIKWIDTSIYRNVCKNVFLISLILDFLFCVRGELVSMTNIRIRSKTLVSSHTSVSANTASHTCHVTRVQHSAVPRSFNVTICICIINSRVIHT